jgi:predicted transcriptional regulator
MKRFTLRFPDGLARDVAECARCHRTSKSAFMRRAIEHGISGLEADRSELTAAQATAQDSPLNRSMKSASPPTAAAWSRTASMVETSPDSICETRD